jgi:hypothetical protein
MDGGESPPADDATRMISFDAGFNSFDATASQALALAAGGMAATAVAGGLAATPAGGMDAAGVDGQHPSRSLDTLETSGDQLPSSGALGLATTGAGPLATAGQDGDGQVLDAETTHDVQADQALPIDVVAHARSLLPTVGHPSIEFDVPVLQEERYKFHALVVFCLNQVIVGTV